MTKVDDLNMWTRLNKVVATYVGVIPFLYVCNVITVHRKSRLRLMLASVRKLARWIRIAAEAEG